MKNGKNYEPVKEDVEILAKNLQQKWNFDRALYLRGDDRKEYFLKLATEALWVVHEKLGYKKQLTIKGIEDG